MKLEKMPANEKVENHLNRFSKTRASLRAREQVEGKMWNEKTFAKRDLR